MVSVQIKKEAGLDEQLNVLRKRFSDQRIKDLIISTFPLDEQIIGLARNFFSKWGCPDLASEEGELLLRKKLL